MEFIQGNENFKPEDCWRGTNINKLCWNNNCTTLYPPVKPSNHHTVTVELPVTPNTVPKPFKKNTDETWTKNHVHLPFSEKSLIQGDQSTVRKRWEIIQEALLSPITDSKQLEEVICSYNSKKWRFPALHSLFTKELDVNETEIFFSRILPKIVSLALRLPSLLQCGIPLLKTHINHSITLSQLQIASLLANAFLCTYPRRNSTQPDSQYANFPCINFSRLFQAESACVTEKLKCLLNYFVRVTTSEPKGLVTYSRRYIPVNHLPQWSTSRCQLPELFISSEGMIENQQGLLQVDFANKFVGGGVLGYGGVQEEIRFVICPELIAAQLFTERLDSTEALIISGVERYNTYEGYSQTFTWTGNHKDQTSSDIYGRKLCTVLAIDASNVARNPRSQYSFKSIQRELNKAYVGFSWGQEDSSRSGNTVATGNWGCGAFKGDVQLKALLQLMAAAEASASVAYFTFGNSGLTNGIYDMYTCLKQYRVSVGRICKLLERYEGLVREGSHESLTLYEFLYNTVVLIQDDSPEKSIKSLGKSVATVGNVNKRIPSPDLSECRSLQGKSSSSFYENTSANTSTNITNKNSTGNSSKSNNRNSTSTSHNRNSTNNENRISNEFVKSDTIDDMLKKIEETETTQQTRNPKEKQNINTSKSLSELDRRHRIDVFNDNFNDTDQARQNGKINENLQSNSSSRKHRNSHQNSQQSSNRGFMNSNSNLSKPNRTQTEVDNDHTPVENNNSSEENEIPSSVRPNGDYVIQIEDEDSIDMDRCVSPDVINSSVVKETPVKYTQDLFSEDEEMQVDDLEKVSPTKKVSRKVVTNTQEMFSEDEEYQIDNVRTKVDGKNNNLRNIPKVITSNKRSNAEIKSCDSTNNCTDKRPPSNGPTKANTSDTPTNKTNIFTNDTSLKESEEVKLFKRIQRNSWADLERSRKDMKCDELEKEVQIMDTSDDLTGSNGNDSPKIRKTERHSTSAGKMKCKKITDYFSREVRK
uniref:poly(ADP-ribose) glycohydrolase n=1 Tax=Cacopsylla melanoneura TaxID=428564 RepID=A0A8D9EJI1_9HEMI